MNQSFKVKPLVWLDFAPRHSKAASPLFGYIRAESWSGAFSVVWLVSGMCDTFTTGSWHTLEAAKAAAQADYEARILAAIDVQPDPRDEVIAGLVDALTDAAAILQAALVAGKIKGADQYRIGGVYLQNVSDTLNASDAALAAANAIAPGMEQTKNEP